MKLQHFAWTLLLGPAISCVAWADWPPQSLRGMVRDSSTGAPIRGVFVVAYYDGTDGRCEAKSDSTGSYSLGVGGIGACVMYQAVGYRARALRWPDELSPSDKDKQLGLGIRGVALEQMPPRKQ